MAELSPDAVLAITRRAKQELRKQMRAIRGACPEHALAERSAAIVERLIQSRAYSEARSLALFWPIADKKEVDLRTLDELARSEKKRVYYPFLSDSKTTGFRLVDDIASLSDLGHGFFEPPSSAPPAERGHLDLVVVPALAADVRGHRLGYNRGYYDVTLPDVCPPARSLIVVFDFQLVVDLPIEVHDFACDAVISDVRGVDVAGIL